MKTKKQSTDDVCSDAVETEHQALKTPQTFNVHEESQLKGLYAYLVAVLKRERHLTVVAFPFEP